MVLHAAIRLEEHTLRLEYALSNPLAVDLYVEQFLPARSWPPARGGYVYVHRDGLLRIHFGTVPNPPLVCLAQEVKLYAERLAPGQTLRASIALALPILECGKLKLADADAPSAPTQLNRLQLVLCYTPAQRDLKLREVVPNSELFEVWSGRPEEAQAELYLPRPVVGLRRSDDFDRPFEAPPPR